jgi:hypothetical protein
MSVIREVSLLMSAMVRACQNGSRYERQVRKYQLNKQEREELSSLLKDLECEHG